jgi:NitT/TauT family transport system permease protein
MSVTARPEGTATVDSVPPVAASVPPAATTGSRQPASVGAAPGRRTPRRGARLGRWLPPAVVFGLVIGVWYFVSYILLSPDRRFMLPPPHRVVKVGFLTWENLHELLNGLKLTTEVAMIGLAIAIGLGVAAAILMSQARWLERSLFPYAVVLQTIPILALVPLIGFWFDYGWTARVIVCVLIALFPVINNTLFGLQSAEAGLHDLFALGDAGRFTRLWKLQLPAAMPATFAGFRISAGLSVIGAIVGDFFFKQGDPGIGILLDLYRSRLQSEQLFAAIILSSLLGVAVFWLFGLLSRLVVGSWYQPDRDSG